MAVTTTWTSPVSATLDKSTGSTIDETMTDAIASNFYNSGGTLGYIGARTQNSANFSVPNNTATGLTFNTNVYDTDPNGAIHSTTVNPSRLTCRTAGQYHIYACVSWTANGTGYRSLGLRLNGATVIGATTLSAVGATVVTDVTVHTIYTMNATDYVELIVSQTSGGSIDALNAGAYSPVFGMAKL